MEKELFCPNCGERLCLNEDYDPESWLGCPACKAKVKIPFYPSFERVDVVFPIRQVVREVLTIPVKSIKA